MNKIMEILKNKRVLAALFIISLFFAAGKIAFLVKSGFYGKNVEVVGDLNELYRLYNIDRSGYLNFFDFLNDLDEKCISGVAVGEKKLMDFTVNSKISVYSGKELLDIFRADNIINAYKSEFYKDKNIDPENTYIILENKMIFEMLLEKLRKYLGADHVSVYSDENYIFDGSVPGIYIISVLKSKEYLADFNIGIDYESIDSICENTRLDIYIRPSSKYRFSAESRLPAYLLDKKIRGVIFEGTEISGYPEYLVENIKFLKSRDLNIGLIEFADQKGMLEAAKAMPSKLIRVHSIPGDELDKYTMPRAVSRISRAVKERNIRLVYLTPFKNISRPRILAENLKYFESIKTELAKSGYTTARYSQSRVFPFSRLLALMIFFLPFAVLLLLLDKIIEEPFVTYMLGGFLAFMLLAYFILDPVAFLKLASFVAAVAVPSFAVISFIDRKIEVKNGILLKTIAYFSVITLFTLSGGIMIASMLGNSMFLSGIYRFTGVKLAMILPFILLFIYLVRHEGLLEKENIIYLYFFISILTSILIILIVRSGNQPSLSQSPFEALTRDILERVLFVRPRIKEIFFGHPFLLAGIYLYLKKYRIYASFFMLFGLVGQISIINSFCHIHTPAHMSLIRVLYGYLLGLFTGIAFVGFCLYIINFKRRNKHVS